MKFSDHGSISSQEHEINQSVLDIETDYFSCVLTSNGCEWCDIVIWSSEEITNKVINHCVWVHESNGTISKHPNVDVAVSRVQGCDDFISL